MKIRILSDLHLEFGTRVPELSFAKDDVIVLAGDIHKGIAGIEWARQTFPDNRVLYVLGNHEFYGHDFDDLIGQARQAAAGSNVTFLEQDFVDIEGIRFLGCTLWTDLLLLGDAFQVECARVAQKRLNDYRLIRRGGKPLSPRDTFDRCEDSKAWLAKMLRNFDGPTVVVTHHGPVPEARNFNYPVDAMTASFSSNLEHLMGANVVLWIYGHTHQSREFKSRGVPVVSNQRGYPHEDQGAFSWDFSVCVP